MKKLLLFLLVLAGGVSTASAKTFYVKDNCNWGSIYLYAYTGEDKNANWPGVKIEPSVYVDWDAYYLIDTGTYSNFIIHNGKESTEVSGCNERSVKMPNDVEEGKFYEFVYSNEGYQDAKYIKWYNLSKNTIYTYNFNITTSEAWSTFNVHLWEYNTKNNKTGWPGNAAVTIDDHHYSYTFKSYMSKLGVLFNKGDGAEKTCDMVAEPGDNYYNICGVNTTGYGEYVKTNASGYATFYNETHPITVPTGIAYVAEDLNNGSAKAYNITDVPYHTPMLIKATANTYYHFAKPTSDPADLTITNAFKAGTGDVVSPGDGPYNYILKGDEFYLANGTTNTVATNKAYLQLSQAATARVLLFDDEEEVTGITSVKSENSNVYFDLQGRRVAQPTKGLYITNGKKFIKK